MPRHSTNTRARSGTPAAQSKRKRAAGRPQQQVPAVHKLKEQFPPRLLEALEPLSTSELKFVLNYVGEANGNAGLAAKLSGMPGSYMARASKASTILRRDRVRHAISRWMETYAMSAVELTWKIKERTQMTIAPFIEFQKDGSLVVKVPDEDTWERFNHWIKRIECDPESGKVTHLEIHDPMKAEQTMAKILKLYSDAPIFALSLYVGGLSDAELLAQLETIRQEQQEERAGQEVAVVHPPAALPPGSPAGGTSSPDTPSTP